MKKLDIIIVNWNSGNQLRECLKSIVKTEKNGFFLNKVIVVDNASTDGSLTDIEELELSITTIKNITNKGFGTACNQGAHGSDADYLLFLNPDTRLFAESLVKPLEFLNEKANERVGILGIQLIDEAGNVSRNCARFPTPKQIFSKVFGLDRLMPQFFPSHFMIEWDHKDNMEVDQVMGAYFLVRCTLFKELGGFDERFFVYYEEVDFSFRARNFGWNSYYLADTQAFHKGGGTSQQVKAKRLFYFLRSRILFGFKHFPVTKAFSLMVLTLLIELITRLTLSLAHLSIKESLEVIKGYILLWGSIPEVFSIVRRQAYENPLAK